MKHPSNGVCCVLETNIGMGWQVANSVTAGLLIEQPVALKALPGALLLGGMKYVALYNTSGAVSRFGPAGVVAASTGNVALASGLMVSRRAFDLLYNVSARRMQCDQTGNESHACLSVSDCYQRLHL